jgi:hypothetical protein
LLLINLLSHFDSLILSLLRPIYLKTLTHPFHFIFKAFY